VLAVLDLEPVCRQVTALVVGVRTDQLDLPTPMPGMSVAALLEHLRGLCHEFTRAATKQNTPGGDPPPDPRAEDLPDDWQEQLPSALAGLAGAWQLPEAWAGETTAGGVTWPAQVMGRVAMNEVLVHGWDLARSTGQPFQPDDASLTTCQEFLAMSADDPSSREGIFGPTVPVPGDASLLDRTIALSGRDPGWVPDRPAADRS
jgi:uncharacterized protein (TIGR03086 family)